MSTHLDHLRDQEEGQEGTLWIYRVLISEDSVSTEATPLEPWFGSNSSLGCSSVVLNGCSELHGLTTGTYQTGKDLTNTSNGARHDLHFPLMSDSGPIIILANKESTRSYWYR
jgi:hypothetical protein